MPTEGDPELVARIKRGLYVPWGAGSAWARANRTTDDDVNTPLNAAATGSIAGAIWGALIAGLFGALVVALSLAAVCFALAPRARCAVPPHCGFCGADQPPLNMPEGGFVDVDCPGCGKKYRVEPSYFPPPKPTSAA